MHIQELYGFRADTEPTRTSTKNLPNSSQSSTVRSRFSLGLCCTLSSNKKVAHHRDSLN